MEILIVNDLEVYRGYGKLSIGNNVRPDAEFAKGKTPQGFPEKLKAAEQKTQQIAMFGYGICEICQEHYYYYHIFGKYIWPSALSHFVEVHGYLPPQEFIDFIMNLGV